MRKDSGSQNLILVLMVVGVLLVIGSIVVASEPKCIAAGCNNKQASATVICINHLVHIQANPLLIALHHPAARSHQEAVIAATLQEVHQAVVLLIRAV